MKVKWNAKVIQLHSISKDNERKVVIKYINATIFIVRMLGIGPLFIIGSITGAKIYIKGAILRIFPNSNLV